MTQTDSLRASCRGDGALAVSVIQAVQALLNRDAYLLRADVNERTVTHRFAIYVEHAFLGWEVDCEYNRDGHDPKEIAFGSGDGVKHGSRVFPDMIFHKRRTADNLVVLELKKSNNPEPTTVTSRSCAGIAISSATCMVSSCTRSFGRRSLQ